ncbi:glycosyltransferase [Micromonospora cathayae]|uniref:Glycosyltransferase n=1 Tax=Micromonospora cathayae TaxID=3028804 RepID=A0ABY7ZXQ9_9ACTN|nr:glycosyltransferase [Micromonospora sp. HUAS 3]WDZ87812.1 glycosyltransferase [Micromonospora sp. HUAS 3]
MTSRHRGRQPRVLYLSFYFPPSRASGVYRARATANHLAAEGWDVTVMAAPLKFLHEAIGSVDEKLAETVDERIRIERPRLNQFVWERDVRRFSRFRQTMPVTARYIYDLGQRIFPEHYASWGWACVRRALRLHARRPFDVVLATGNPFASFAAAWLFHRLARVPYVVDYRDSWTLDLFADEPAYEDDHPVWAWERRVLRGASRAVFVNDALRGWHAERYPEVADRMRVVPNGWDPDLLTVLDDAPGAGPRTAAGPLRFSYLGTVTNNQPVEELVEAFRLARQHPDLDDAVLNVFGHLGFFKGSDVQLLERLGLDPAAGQTDDPASGVRYRGPVAKTDVAAAYAESDVLVFLAGGARYVTSGKIFEYMASGRPIVSVHAPGIAATEVLAGYPLWFNADSLDPEQIAQTMIAAGKAARDLTPEAREAAIRHASRYTRQRVLGPLEAELRQLAGAASREEQEVVSA